jgi:predicted dehydrogenase
MKKIQGAVVGLGYWGPNLVRNFLKIPQVKIKTVCDTSSKVVKKFYNKYPLIPITLDYHEILRDPEIAFVAIATPLTTHFLLAKQALLAGKHVLIEKPMTQTSNEAKALKTIAEEQKKILMVGHTFIYTDAIQKIKKIISKKSFGKFLYFDSTRINLGRLQADTNVIWDLAPHDLSILSWFFDSPPIIIQAQGSSHISKNTIEIAHIFLTYKNNVTAHIHVSWLSPVKMRNILIGGSNQMIHYNDIEPSEKIKVYNKSVSLRQTEVTPFLPAYRSGSVYIPALRQQEGLHTQLLHFIQCIEKNKLPITHAGEGIKVVELLEAIDKAVQHNIPITLHEKEKLY